MTNLETTEEIFSRFGNHDIDGILELLDDDARIEFYGVETIPYAGEYQGNKACRKFFETVLSSVDIHVFEAEQFVTEGETVIVVGRLHLTVKRNGNAIISPFVHVITCRNGKWLHFRDFMNTAVAQKAFSDHAS